MYNIHLKTRKTKKKRGRKYLNFIISSVDSKTEATMMRTGRSRKAYEHKDGGNEPDSMINSRCVSIAGRKVRRRSVRFHGNHLPRVVLEGPSTPGHLLCCNLPYPMLSLFFLLLRLPITETIQRNVNWSPSLPFIKENNKETELQVSWAKKEEKHGLHVEQRRLAPNYGSIFVDIYI